MNIIKTGKEKRKQALRDILDEWVRSKITLTVKVRVRVRLASLFLVLVYHLDKTLQDDTDLEKSFINIVDYTA